MVQGPTRAAARELHLEPLEVRGNLLGGLGTLLSLTLTHLACYKEGEWRRAATPFIAIVFLVFLVFFFFFGVLRRSLSYLDRRNATGFTPWG